MDEVVFYTLISVGGVSLLSFSGLFLMPDRVSQRPGVLLALVGLAVGALLGDAFTHLIPEASATLNGERVAIYILIGMCIFFVFEKFLHWHHHHEPHAPHREDCDDCDHHIAPFGKLIIASDALHNVADGAIIAAGFTASFEVGVATTIAVALHEIPQEIGDFGALIHAGFSRTRALVVNFVSALSAFMGAALVFILGASFAEVNPALSALTAGAFIYIASVDLVPELHKSPRPLQSFIQLVAIIIGIFSMIALKALE